MRYEFSGSKWHFASFSVELNLRTYFNNRFAQRSLKNVSLKTSGFFLSSFLVRVLPPQFVFGVCEQGKVTAMSFLEGLIQAKPR